MNISVFGTGYVGLVTGACLANLGHTVCCVDIDHEKIIQLQKGTIPFYEPGLREVVQWNVEKGRLTFSSDVQQAVQQGEVIFNCVGTPSTEQGGADLRAVFEVAKTVAKYAEQPKVLINKSTVPPGTARECDRRIKEVTSVSVEVVSNPEFLAEGKAVYDFTHPDKIVAGAQSEAAFSTLRKVYTGRVRTYIPIVETDWETAEMIKYANNSFLATKISFINEIANICDLIGADVRIVAQAMGMDYRINPRFLSPGMGYGGSCFPKDVRALYHLSGEKKYEAALLREVDLVNERQKRKIMQKVQGRFGVELGKKQFTLWGLSFKPNTSDIREAPSLTVIQELLKEGAVVVVYDPIAMEEMQKIFPHAVQYASSLAESVQGSSAIIVLTEWDEFRHAPLHQLGKVMNEKVMFDGRNIYEPEMVREEGFEYYGVGRQ
ncbi:MAG: UDP-glucose/GDP-mannose dehydrogenase family protein [Nanoarchaeota archaeon]